MIQIVNEERMENSLESIKIDSIKIEYVGYRWDGTMDGADAICLALDNLKPDWNIAGDPFTGPYRQNGERELIINERTPGSNSKSWELTPGQILVCSMDERGEPQPEKVIDDAELSKD